MPENAPEHVHDLLIVGAGPVGLALALALKDAGLDIVLADARAREAVTKDPRDLALAHGTRLTLQGLGVWDGLPTTAIEHIHISHQGGLGRTLIDAAEHELPALGYVASAGALAAALRKAVDAAGIPVFDETEITNLAAGEDDVIASLAGAGRPTPTLRARLAACAEGGLRAGDPNVVEHDYGQHALIADVQVAGGQIGDLGLVEHRDARCIDRLAQGRGERAGRGDVAERGQLVFGGVDQGAAEPALVRDVDVLDRRARQPIPHAEALQREPGAVGEREVARVLRHRFAGARVGEHDVEAGVLERKREREADRAGADDQQVMDAVVRFVSHGGCPASMPRCPRPPWARPR